MAESDRIQWNKHQIEEHLKSAVSVLTPDVLQRIDLKTPQDIVTPISPVAAFRRRTQVFGTLAAACLCVIVLAGGTYGYQNSKIDSVIGIDVNPSIELSVNRKDKVLSAQALNADAVAIMDDMNLKGVDLNVAVNAVIGSMVKHGYLDDLDNAILVTVSNDSISKAANLRSTVVDDIQTSLEENQVKAVVYDQQAIEMDEVKQLAGEYGISYGKAYFLQELIDQNLSLTEADMGSLAPLTMEEIAKEITDRSYALGGHTDKTEDPVQTLAQATTAAPSTTAATAPETTTMPESTTMPETTTLAETTIAPTTARPTPAETPAPLIPTAAPPVETTQETVVEGKLKIDYVDYENGVVTVNFATKVKWKNPTVSVKDGDGNAYSCLVDSSDSESCQILVSGLRGGTTYTFILGGVSPKNGKSTTVKGTFETPIIGESGADDEEPETTVPETTAAPTTEASTTAAPTTAPQTTAAPSETAATQPKAESQTKASESPVSAS